MSTKLIQPMIKPAGAVSGSSCCTKWMMLALTAAAVNSNNNTPMPPVAMRSRCWTVCRPLSLHITNSTDETSITESKPNSSKLSCRYLAANTIEATPSMVQCTPLATSRIKIQSMTRRDGAGGTPLTSRQLGLVTCSCKQVKICPFWQEHALASTSMLALGDTATMRPLLADPQGFGLTAQILEHSSLPSFRKLQHSARSGSLCTSEGVKSTGPFCRTRMDIGLGVMSSKPNLRAECKKVLLGHQR